MTPFKTINHSYLRPIYIPEYSMREFYKRDNMSNLIIHNETGSETLQSALIHVIKLLNNEEPNLRMELSKLPTDFFRPWSRVAPSGLRVIMNAYDKEIIIQKYYPKWPFTKAIGYTKFGSKTIYVNAYRISKLTIQDFIGLILHELAHLCGFGHGKNKYNKTKANSVNYWLSNNAELFV